MNLQDEFRGYEDVPLSVQVEFARCRLPLHALLSLEEGTVIPLPQSAGQELAVYIGGQLAASGELASGESRLSVKLTRFQPAAG